MDNLSLRHSSTLDLGCVNAILLREYIKVILEHYSWTKPQILKKDRVDKQGCLNGLFPRGACTNEQTNLGVTQVNSTLWLPLQCPCWFIDLEIY